MAEAIPNVPWTINGVMALGSTETSRMRAVPAPRAFDAATKLVSLTDSTLARITRAKAGMVTMPIASNALIKPGPSTETIAIANSSDGNASSTSITRMMTLSTQPPR